MADSDRGPGFGETLRQLMGAAASEGEAAYGAAERTFARPRLDFNGFLGGFTDQGKKTVIPARGGAKVSMRWCPSGTRRASSIRSAAAYPSGPRRASGWR